MEKRLINNTKLQKDYISFRSEYEAMDHMREMDSTEVRSNICYYLPHHPVFKVSSSTSKTRVVFNVSVRTSSGVFLNDILHVGPTTTI